MATIGLGTGVYTGTFYLFPYILAIKDTAERCGHLDFSLLTECGETIANEVPLNPAEILIKTLPPLYLWSFGTSLGELPPYYLGKHSKKWKLLRTVGSRGGSANTGRHDNRAGGVAELHV